MESPKIIDIRGVSRRRHASELGLVARVTSRILTPYTGHLQVARDAGVRYYGITGNFYHGYSEYLMVSYRSQISRISWSRIALTRVKKLEKYRF